MCDYSLQNVKTRDAALHDELIVHNFNTGTRGFACKDDLTCAVCVKPGTEIAFEEPISAHCSSFADYVLKAFTLKQKPGPKVAIFRQVDTSTFCTHHDALEFPDGRQIKLSLLKEGQRARILQMPAAPKTPEEAKAQERLVFVG